MRMRDYARWIAHDVREAPMFEVLSLSGITIGIAGIVVFLALTAGVKQLVTDRITRQVDLYTLEIPNSGSGQVVSPGLFLLLVADEGVRDVIPVHTTYLTVAYGDHRAVMQAESYAHGGGEAASRDLRTQFPIVAGRVLEPNDTGAVLIPQKLLEYLITDRADTVRVLPQLNLMAMQGVNGAPDSVLVSAWVRGVLQQTPRESTVLYLSDDLIRTLVVGGANGEEPQRYDVVTRDLPSLERVRAMVRKTGLKTRSVLDRVDTARNIIDTVRVIFLFVFGIGALFAVFNIIITLTTHVLQRRREIAMLNALGATSRQIQAIFVFHGAVLGAAGAGLGVACAGLVIWIARYVFGQNTALQQYRSIFIVIPSEVVVVALSTVVICVISAFVPARIAMRQHPLETLRAE